MLARIAALACAYFVAGWLGLKIPYVGAHITLVWLPTGIAVAALLLWGRAVWPGVYVGALFVNLIIGSSWPLAAGIAIGNTLGPLLAARWLERTGFHATIDRQRDVGLFVTAAALGMTVSAAGGVACLYFAGLSGPETVGLAWLTWWMGDTVGVLLSGPLLLTLNRQNLSRLWVAHRELLPWAALAGVVAWLAFIRDYEQLGRTLPLAFLTLPLLAWAALRFGITGASLASLAYSVIAAWSTATGHGTFFLPDASISLLLLWAYMATCVLTGLVITALQAERLLTEKRMEHLLDEQRAMLENDLVGIVTVRNRSIVWANPAFEKMLGFGAGELAGMPTRINYPSEAAYRTFGAAAYPVLSAGKVYRAQIEHVRKDGTGIWVDLSGAILDRKSDESLWTFVDITERVQLERSVAESEQRMELALAGAELGLWDLDLASGRFTHNERLMTMLGYEPGEIEVDAATFRVLLHPEDVARFGDAFYAHLKGKTPSLDIEYRLCRSDDRWTWVLSRGKVVERGTDGRAVRMIGTNLDISARKEGEAALKAREARLATLISSLQDVVIVFGTDGRIIEYFEPRSSHGAVHGSCGGVVGKATAEVFSAATAGLYDAALAGIVMDGKPRTFEYSEACDGNERIAQATISALIGESRFPIGFLAAVRDMTAERTAQRELARLAHSNALLLRSVGEGIYGVDRDYRATFVNPAALAMLGYTEAELLGQNLHAIFHHARQDGTPYPDTECPVRLTMKDGQIRHNEDEWLWRKNGSGFPAAMTVTPVTEDGARLGVVVIFQDITARKADEAHIFDLAFYDPLTRLPNRRLLLDRLGLALPASARRGSYGAVLFLDLDNFKPLNDTAGHEAGDLLLVEVARRLRGCVRGEDTVARFGGDEFVVLLEDLSPDIEQAAARAALIAEKIREALAGEYELHNRVHGCTSSIGVRLFKGTGMEAAEVLKHADAAMYQAKEAGGNAIRFFLRPRSAIYA